MKEAVGDLWVLSAGADAIVLTTNGFIKSNGNGVMGRGIALQASYRMSWLPWQLGRHLQKKGNHVGVLGVMDDGITMIISMPVKPSYGPDGQPGWLVDAQPDLIQRSARELAILADEHGLKNIWLPRPGCGNGRLDWSNVRPLIEPLLDDRFTVVTR